VLSLIKGAKNKLKYAGVYLLTNTSAWVDRNGNRIAVIGMQSITVVGIMLLYVLFANWTTLPLTNSAISLVIICFWVSLIVITACITCYISFWAGISLWRKRSRGGQS